jgi:hypothetical protein
VGLAWGLERVKAAKGVGKIDDTAGEHASGHVLPARRRRSRLFAQRTLVLVRAHRLQSHAP